VLEVDLKQNRLFAKKRKSHEILQILFDENFSFCNFLAKTLNKLPESTVSQIYLQKF
jgi:hypothetical protein